MTVTRAPCELDKMSLFQDLKLKRRKVDSRCSSDGESVADTSTSSPDLVSPSSPKMSEGLLNPPSPDSTPLPSTIHSAEPTVDKNSSRLEDSNVFDGGGGGGGGEGEDDNGGRGEDNGETGGGGDVNDNTSINNNGTSGDGPTTASVIRPLSVIRSQSPPIRPIPTSSPSVQPPRPHSSPGRPANASPVIRHNPSVVLQQQHQQPPASPPKLLSTLVTCQQEPTSSSPPIVSKGRSVIISHTAASLSPTQLWLKHSRINGVKPELIGGNFSGALYAAGDVKPPSNNPLPRVGGSNTPVVRQTPTVIMGEAGGVRTMIWSQPTLCTTPTSPDLPTTSNWPSPNTNIGNPEESAAQMLLNLGQDRLRLPVTRAPVSPQSSSPHFTNTPLNMERLWAGDLRQLPINQQTQALNLSSPTPIMYSNPDIKSMTMSESSATSESQEATEEEEQPMICMICEDKATGLHYGIITCEGCKGFFKRTVQNRRVYTCVADGNCEITKAQRNRCQYCRFKKCIEQGMVLQAVREDRMPGGRNSGAVYNLYKVKYKKHKKPACKQQQHHQQQQQQHPQQQQQQQQQHHGSSGGGIGGSVIGSGNGSGGGGGVVGGGAQGKSSLMGVSSEKTLLSPHQIKTEQPSSIPANLVNGTILKTALTNPSEVVRLRQRLDSAVSSSRDRNFSIEYSLSMIKTLIDCDEFQDIATLQNLDDLLDHNTDLSEKLCHIGDSIVYKLVQWTKRLPFYLELPVEVHTRLLTHKWHELLVLTTSAYQAIHRTATQGADQITTVIEADFNHEVETNLCTLQSCLTSMMGREITIEQLRQDVGLMIEKITHVTLMFRQIKLTMEEYVCLKVITMLNQAKPASSSGNSELESIHERYMTCLRVYTQHMYPQQTTRFQDLLSRLPEIQSAASLLLESKMFYVPFLLNSAIQR